MCFHCIVKVPPVGSGVTHLHAAGPLQHGVLVRFVLLLLCSIIRVFEFAPYLCSPSICRSRPDKHSKPDDRPPPQIIFGGAGLQGTLADVWIFNTQQLAWTRPHINGPVPAGANL